MEAALDSVEKYLMSITSIQCTCISLSLCLSYFSFLPVFRSYETDKASIAKAEDLKADIVTRYNYILTR